MERNHLEPSVNSAVVPSQVRWRVNLILIDEMSQISNRHPIHHRRSDSGRVLSYEMICFVDSQPQVFHYQVSRGGEAEKRRAENSKSSGAPTCGFHGVPKID